jgi:hypothetical protein
MRASPLRVQEDDGTESLVRIRPHDGGDDSFTFSYRYVVCLTFEKLPLDFWDREGLTIATSGFARLLSVEHAALRGHDYSAIFAMVKVETPAHIPHRLAFHKANNSGNVADVYINEIWDARNVSTHKSHSNPPPPPPPSARNQPPNSFHRSSQNHHRSRSNRPRSAYTWVRSGTTAPPPSPSRRQFEHGESSNSVTLPDVAPAASNTRYLAARATKALATPEIATVQDLMALLHNAVKCTAPTVAKRLPNSTAVFSIQDLPTFEVTVKLGVNRGFRVRIPVGSPSPYPQEESTFGVFQYNFQQTI